MTKIDYLDNGIQRQFCNEETANNIAKLPVTGMDNRSNWYYFRLPDGDLIIGFYPQGDTYFSTENERTI